MVQVRRNVNSKKNLNIFTLGTTGLLLLLMPFAAQAASVDGGDWLNLTAHPIGYISIVLFTIAYLMVTAEPGPSASG